MSKGTIIYIGGFEMPDKNAAAQRVVANAKVLNSLGFKVVFIGVSKSIDEAIVKEKHFNSDVYVKKYPTGVKEWFKHWVSYKDYVKIVKSYKNVKGIIAYNFSSYSLYKLNTWAKKNQIKIISDCTEWYEVAKGESFLKKRIKTFDIYTRMNIMHTKLDGAIVISNYLQSFYEKKGVKTINIPPLVDSKAPKWLYQEQSVRIEQDRVEVIYVGSPFSIETKGQKDRLDNLVGMFIDLSSEIKVRLNIVGIEKEMFLEFYPDLQYNLEDEVVVFYGRKPHLEAVEMLKKCDFSIFLREDTLANRAGFPTKFAEAITLGVPVLTNKSTNLSDFLIEGENGFWLDTSNSNSLKESLRKALLTDRVKLNQMKKNTIKTELFDFRKYTSIFEAFLKEI